MTTIAYRDGIIAADSWASLENTAGARRHQCKKLYRKTIKKGNKEQDVIIATAGTTSPSLVFVEWFGSKKAPPESLLYLGGDFTCLILTPDGLFEADAYCVLDEILEPYYAIGSGATAAIAAMRCGKSARDAVRVAASIDPYTGGRIVTMSLEKPRMKRTSSTRSTTRANRNKNR